MLPEAAPHPGTVAPPGTRRLRRAMACTVTVEVAAHSAGPAGAAADAALAWFAAVEAACTRFDPASPLMRANARPTRWHRLPAVCLDVLAEAQRAHVATRGRFDPRVHDTLVALGYDRSLPFGGPDPVAPGPTAAPGRAVDGPWELRVHRRAGIAHLGGSRVDLGGIGKGFAVARAAGTLRARGCGNFTVDAGGDCYLAGSPDDGGEWRVGVEDPAGGREPVAVLGLSDRAVATSSTRIRRWRVGDREVHHLIDPATGTPGGAGLAAVTVVGDDPVDAEVWSKVLFLAGRNGVAAAAEDAGTAAFWVDDGGVPGWSGAMAGHLRWTAPGPA